MVSNVPVAIVGAAHVKSERRAVEAENRMVLRAVRAAMQEAGVTKDDVGFTCSGSGDYLAGGTFAFVQNLEAIGAWPPISESHVEMDGAWAMYEAWNLLQEGEVDVALVYGSGKSSPGDIATVYPLMLDPYFLTPLGLDPVSLAALQARALLESGKATERDFAEVVARNRASAIDNPNAQVSGKFDVDELLKADYVRDPLRRHDLPPVSDGACAVILATADKAAQLSKRPAWITGIAHRIDVHQPGMRDLTVSPSTTAAAKAAGLDAGPIEVAELMAPFSFQELILKEALGLGDDVEINPSGGALAANPIMATGLIRVAEAAHQVTKHGKGRTLAHVTGGLDLQQNLVTILGEARP
jgi:acetyl-CoA acetyltransferase